MKYQELPKTSLEKEILSNNIYDIIIIGAGPAGLQASICAGRAKLKTLLIDKALPGGETATAYKINNLAGYPNGILGENLAKEMENQLKEYDIDCECLNVENITNIGKKTKNIITDTGKMFSTKMILLATGLEPKRIDPRLERLFLGRGLSYDARSNINSYKHKNVAVIGGGNCACYAADFLSNFAKKTYLIHSSNSIKAVRLLKEKVQKNPTIELIWNSEIKDIFGIEGVEKLKIRHTINNQETWIDCKGIFIYVGRIPPKEIINLEINQDEYGFIITDEYMKTNIPGVFAAGDIRSKQIRQIATALSDGMIAAINIERELRRIK